MTATAMVAIVLGTCLAGFVQGLSGFAFGLVALSLWAWTIEPQLAGPMVVWGSWIGQILSLGSVRGGLRWRRALPFVVGGVAGVPVGAWLLRYVDVAAFRGCVGVVLIGYSSAMLFARRLPALRRGGALADGAVGAIGGVMGGLGGLTGPAPTLWCTLRRWDKDVQRSVFQVFNLAMHTLTLAVYFLGGTLTVAMVPAFALMVPVAVVPTLVGVVVYRRVDEQAFRRVVLGLLLASGVALVVSVAVG
jgi:uncharacterized membrane protein YfcA